MKRLLVALLLAVLGATHSDVAQARYPPNVPFLAYITYNALIPKIALTGVLTWRATDHYGYSQWHDSVAQALNTGSSYNNSLGNILIQRPGIFVREATPFETPDILLDANTPSYVSGKCGGDWATACVYVLDPLSIHAYFNAASMSQWALVSQAAVDEHELMHPTGHLCDQYPGGCPRADTGAYDALGCDGSIDSLMTCGLGPRYPVGYDLDNLDAVYLPPPIQGAFLDLSGTWGPGVAWYWSPNSGLAGVNTCTRVSVWKRLIGANDYAWAGINSASCAPGFQGVAVRPESCVEYFVSGENAVTGTWKHNLVYAGTVPCR